MNATTADVKTVSVENAQTVDEKIDALVETVNEQATVIEQQNEVIEQQSDRIDTLEERVDDTESKAKIGMETAFELEEAVTGDRGSFDAQDTAEEEGSLIERVEDIEDGGVDGGSGDETPTPQTPETTFEPETPLEDVVNLPSTMAEESLTANQERAYFIAKDITDYAKSVPAGRVLTSSEVRRVLTAKEESRAHTQTVSRVMDRLEELGKDDVQLKETRGGERAVVFTDEIVERLQKAQSNTVVIGDERVEA